MAVETVPVAKPQWLDLILRLDIPSQRKAVAFALSKFANADGSRVFPGQAKVGNMAGLHETNAGKHIRALEACGMLTVTKRGGGRGGATNTYRLSRPADITGLPLWLDPDMNRIDGGETTAEEHTAPAPGETEDSHEEQEALAPGVSVDNPDIDPVDNSETQGASARYSTAAEEETDSVSERNRQRFEQEYTALALEDLPKTSPRPTQHPAGLPKATPSLVLVPPIRDDDETIRESQPPGDDELEAARAILAAMRRPVADAWRRAARAELEAAGDRLTKRTVEIRAADLAASAAAEQATNGVA